MSRVSPFSMLLAAVIVILPLMSYSQLTTVGPVPPPGTDRGFLGVTKAQVTIPNVPAYIWHHGCGPTATGMLIGYWDLEYPFLVDGDATYQSDGVNRMIADDNGSSDCFDDYWDHYRDYSCPLDNGSNLIPDESEPGGNPHTDNCVADFMKTSQSYYGNAYGWSYFSEVDDAIIEYINYMAPGLEVYATNHYFGEFSFQDYQNEIDNGRPVGTIVDTDGDGSTDHFVTGIGYDADNNYYGIYDTWDQNVHWYEWRQLGSGSWSILGFTTMDFGAVTKPILINDSCAFTDLDDDVFDPGDTVEIYVYMINYGVPSDNVDISVTSNNGSVVFLTQDVDLGYIDGYGTTFDNETIPLEFVAPDIDPQLVTFTITVSAPDFGVNSTFELERVLGRAQALIVDDDRGEELESVIRDDLYDNLVLSHHWNKAVQGIPAGSDLNDYEMVFWYTGDSSDNYFEAADIAAMQDFLDGGGCLFLTGQGLASEIHDEDSVFMHNYLHCTYGGSIVYADRHVGVDGSPVGNYTYFYLGPGHSPEMAECIMPVNGGIEEFYPYYDWTIFSGVSYRNSQYRSLFVTWRYETLLEETTLTSRHVIMSNIIRFFTEITYICGDASDDGQVNLLDITYLINYLYSGGSPPVEPEAADVNNDGNINLMDVTWLIQYLYKDGAEPVCN